jgi:PadR family transcriptional regulator, regulatory protein AphA
MSTPKLNPFSYAVLALVGRDGAGPHDIVRMMRQGSVFWTTSESHFYAEPKRLAKLGYLKAEKQPGQTGERTHYTLTPTGRRALREWLAAPAAMPRIQNEASLKLLAGDESDDATILASLRGLHEQIAAGLEEMDGLEARSEVIPHRARYLRLLADLGRSTLAAQSAWLQRVEEELGDA